MAIGLLVFLVATTGPRPESTAAPSPSSVPAHPRPPHPGAVAADDLFSLRLRRRFAAYMRLRLLEMRKAGLERAADAVEHRISVDQLLNPAK